MLKKSKKITVLLAAAVALLAVSVSAAHFGTLQEIVWELKTAFFVSGETEDGSFAAIRIPEVRLLEREDRVILNVEGEETDITDALETEQCYLVEQAEEDGWLVIEITGTPEDCVCTITGYQTGMEEALFTVTRGKNEPLTEADISYSVAWEETAAPDETVEIGGSAYGKTQTVTVTKDDTFTVGHYNGEDIYGLVTDDPAF